MLPLPLSYIQHKDKKEGVHTMGQRGVHATINKDENTGRFVVHLTTVQ